MCGVATPNSTKVKVRQLLREIWPIKRGWDMKKPSHGRPDLLLSLRDLPESCLRTADRTLIISRNLRLCGLSLSWQLLMFQYFHRISRLCFHLPLNMFKSSKCEKFLSSPKLQSWLWDSPSLLFNGYWGLVLQEWRDRDPRPEVKRVSGAIPPLPYISSWRAQGELHLHLWKSNLL